VGIGKNGGAAFPRPFSEKSYVGEKMVPQQDGMTLRQYYAAAMLANPGNVGSPSEIATWSFQVADALIEFEKKERENGTNV